MTWVSAVLLVFFLYLFAISREIRRQKWFCNGSVVLALGILVSGMLRLGGAEKPTLSISADGVELIGAAISLMIVLVGGREEGRTDENAKADIIEALGRMGESVEQARTSERTETTGCKQTAGKSDARRQGEGEV